MDKKSPVRIMYVIGQLSMGGTERQLLELVKHIDRTRFDPCVVSLCSDAHLEPEFKRVGCNVHLLDREKQGRLKAIGRLCQIIRMLRPRIVHAFAYASRAAIPAAVAMRGVKTIVSLRTDPAWQIGRLDKVVNSFADLILSNSKMAGEKVERLWPGSRASVVYNGLDVTEFDLASQIDVNNTNDVFGAQENCIKICAGARLVSVKGLDVLLEAFARVRVAAPNVQLLLVGDGPFRRTLEERAEKPDLAGSVIFLGERSDVPSILMRCQMGVLSSRVEGLSNAIIEYMAARLPVVATHVGGNPELVIPDETGLLVPPNDPRALAEALTYLLRNPEIARRMGAAGRERVETHFTMERMVRETENLYLDLL